WRYWDGVRWTEHVWVAGHNWGAVPAAAPAPPVPQQQPDADAAETGGTGLPGVGVACVAFVLAATSAFGVSAALRAAGRPGGDVTTFALSEIALWAWLVGAVVFVSRRRGTGSLAHDFGWRFRREDIGVGALAAAIARGASVVVVIPLYGAFHDLVRNPQVGVPVHHVSGGLVLA